MKKKIFSVVLFAAGLLSGCSSEESVSTPETVGQAGVLTFSFPAPSRSVTYAYEDDTTVEGEVVEAVGDESVINDATVYMFENSVGGKLVAKQSASSAGGVQSVTIDVSDFTSGASYVFYAVANASGNITDNFIVGSSTLDGFTATVAANTGSNPIPGSNMLMVGYKTILNLSSSTSSSQTIILRHRVARFDIDNLTADEDETNDNLAPTEDDYNPKETFFTITKIRVFRTLSEGYLTEETNSDQPHPALTANSDLTIPVSGSYGGDAINEGLTEGVFYLWPGELAAKADIQTGTAIEVEGYSAGNILRLVTVQLESARPILANKRYKLTVSRIDQTNLNFTLTSSGWGEEGDDPVEATPKDAGAFEYGGFSLNSVSLAGDIDLSENTGDNVLSFYTDGDSKATGTLTASLALTLGDGYASNDVTPVPDGDPVVTYSLGKVRRAYRITLPRTTYPINGTLTIDDGKGKTKVFNITSVPVYDNTGHRPVPVSGNYSGEDPVKNEVRYWAPVNVGASNVVYSTDVAGCGYYFQWGRSYTQFIYDSTNGANDKVEGPLSAEDAAAQADKFIITSESPNDWLQGGDVAGRWQGDNAQGPCPVGWRVPTATELDVLRIKGVFDVDDNNCFRIPSDAPGASNEYLYLPAAGVRVYGGSWYSQGTHGYYWSSTVSGTNAMWLHFYNSAPTVAAESRARGGSVRCLQE
ncbi:MAG: FimB/Mfa2 family fimbrial subunit [Prevotella sp.]|nr:FimB/Mfa2 family fimbrial subunit [Prevotella sp.]